MRIFRCNSANSAVAKQTYQRVLTVEPTSRQALLHLGMIEAKFGNRQEAATPHYLVLIKHDPAFMDTYVQLANLHEGSGDLAAAEQVTHDGNKTRTDMGNPGYLWRGKIFKSRARLIPRRPISRRAIHLAPDVPFPKEALASLLAAENRKLAEARTLAEAAVAADKTSDTPRHARFCLLPSQPSLRRTTRN